MRLFHISEDSNVKEFVPRKSYRDDMKESPPVVWAVNEKCMVNFLTPRDCPRLTYHIGPETTEVEKEMFFSSKKVDHVVIIEHDWYERMKNTTLYIYEFEREHFYLQDTIAGYYVSEHTEIPIAVHEVTDLFSALAKCNVEVRLLPRLWDMRKKIIDSNLNYSLCRMKFAQKALTP